MKRIVFSDDPKNDIRAIPQQIAMNVLAAIHRMAESGGGAVKMLKDQDAEKRLLVGDYRVRFIETSEEIRINSVKNRKDAYR